MNVTELKDRLKSAPIMFGPFDPDWWDHYCPHCMTDSHGDCMRSPYLWEVHDLRGFDVPVDQDEAKGVRVPFLVHQTDNGRQKVVLMAAGPDLVRRFMAGEVVKGLTDLYGDPERGFAGGYTS